MNKRRCKIYNDGSKKFNLLSMQRQFFHRENLSSFFKQIKPSETLQKINFSFFHNKNNNVFNARKKNKKLAKNNFKALIKI